MSDYIPSNSTDFACFKCGKIRTDIRIKGKARGHCHPCYKKYFWKPKLFYCPRCERERGYHGKGLCNGCYNYVFNIENIKKGNTAKYHNIDFETYKNATKECVVCGFNKIVDLHHLDMNHDNNSVENLTGLCPNHHKMVHHRNFQKEVFQQLKDKGFQVPEGYKDDNLFKNSSS